MLKDCYYLKNKKANYAKANKNSLTDIIKCHFLDRNRLLYNHFHVFL